MSLDSWLQRHRRQRLDLVSGEIVSLNLVDRPKPSIDEAPTSTVADPADEQPIIHPPAGPWNRKYLLLSIALIPLVFSLLAPNNTRDIAERFSHTVGQLPPRDQARILEGVLKKNITLQDLIMRLPDHRIEGAHLSRDSWMHWLYAMIAAGVFFGALTLVFPASRATPRQLLRIGIFTGTIGILLLICFQAAAAGTDGVWLKGFGIVTAIFYIVKFIGYSYAAALDPKNGFLLSAMGFTFGVGFCEEVAKMLPLVRHFRYHATLDWRGACLWGLASGVGFGVSEGISYASSYYNGVQSASIYAVRFISCVGLHAIWSGAAAVTLFERQSSLQTHCSSLEFIWRLLQIVAIPMILHGLYDTLLKKDMPAVALLAAVVSFGWMVYQFERYHRKEHNPETDSMVAAGAV